MPAAMRPAGLGAAGAGADAAAGAGSLEDGFVETDGGDSAGGVGRLNPGYDATPPAALGAVGKSGGGGEPAELARFVCRVGCGEVF